MSPGSQTCCGDPDGAWAWLDIIPSCWTVSEWRSICLPESSSYSTRSTRSTRTRWWLEMFGDVWRTFLWRVIPHLEPSWLLLRGNIFPTTCSVKHITWEIWWQCSFCSSLMFKQDNQSDGRRLFCAKLRTDAELLGSRFCLYFDCKCLHLIWNALLN